jgi:anaerobic nitric oxide reductase flavorubredoxin
MLPVEIKPSIYWVGVNDRQKELFEGLWPVRNEGVSYNSYLINDTKKAVIDMSSLDMTEEWLQQIAHITDPAGLDYVIINHMEPDHSGALELLRRIAPKVTLVGTAKTAEMLESFYGIVDNIMVVKDGDTLDLGTRQLKFITTPWVHWPETMMTYEINEKILFSCDGFGSYGSLDGGIFDDTTNRVGWYEEQALRYYTNIVASFSKMVEKAISKVCGVPLAVVAPSHGLIWRANPERMIDLYGKWAQYSGQAGENGVTLLYASMYGNTKRMMEAVAQGITNTGVPLTIFDVAKTPASYLLPSIWTQKGVMIGAPTYEGGLFPFMAQALDVVKRKHISGKIAAGFGSCAWQGGGQRELAQTVSDLKWTFGGSLEFTGEPGRADLESGLQFGEQFARSVLEFTTPKE